jgi:23S rRNA (pseudouridine1915-N3)-methyltransferase
MRVRVIAVGTRMPEWVRSACEQYLQRLRAPSVTLVQLEPARHGGDATRAVTAEGERLLALLRPQEHVVALDERGRELTSAEFAGWLRRRQQDAQDLAFLIGGADGLAAAVLERADLTFALSRLTLPHALARVLLAEQLYRAHSILTHHPYHRA